MGVCEEMLSRRAPLRGHDRLQMENLALRRGGSPGSCREKCAAEGVGMGSLCCRTWGRGGEGPRLGVAMV